MVHQIGQQHHPIEYIKFIHERCPTWIQGEVLNMEMTLKIKTMAMRWRDIIMDSTEINDFCMNKYGKKPTIFMGVNGKKLPDKKHCPAIFILPGIKAEGGNQDVLSYGLCVSWTIANENILVDGETVKWSETLTGNVIEFLGMYETDDFGQLIYETLQQVLIDNSFPISKIEYNIDTQAYFPQFPGYMVLTTELEPAMGENIIY